MTAEHTVTRSDERDDAKRLIQTHFDLIDTTTEGDEGPQLVRLTVASSHWGDRKAYTSAVSAVVFTPSTPTGFAVTRFSVFGQDPAPYSRRMVAAARYSRGALAAVHVETLEQVTEPAMFAALLAWAVAQREVNAA